MSCKLEIYGTTVRDLICAYVKIDYQAPKPRCHRLALARASVHNDNVTGRRIVEEDLFTRIQNCLRLRMKNYIIRDHRTFAKEEDVEVLTEHMR